MDKMRMESVDMTAQNVEKIGALFPNCITETVDENGKPKKAINFELLRQMLSEDVLDGDEAYEFTWVGKKAAIVEANKPIRKTLRPCKEESVDWDNTQNLYIEGDNLEVLKLLQESYLSRVKMIYIDPPYNTGGDFIYEDDFKVSRSEYDEDSGALTENGERLFKNTDSNGRFHSDWCSMLYPRLMLARNLLSDDGLIFISIDENEVENLKTICNEVFGKSNSLGAFIWRKKDGGGQAKEDFVIEHEYIVVYMMNRANKILTDLADKRIRKNREFFNIRPEEAFRYLKLIAEMDDTAEINAPEDEQGSSETESSHPKSNTHLGDYTVETDEIFYLSNGVADGKMKVQNGCEYVVLEGSVLDPKITSSESNIRKSRKEHADSLSEDGTVVIRDIIFNTPSGAANFIRGGACNGKTYWRTASDRPLSEFISYRKDNSDN